MAVPLDLPAPLAALGIPARVAELHLFYGRGVVGGRRIGDAGEGKVVFGGEWADHGWNVS